MTFSQQDTERIMHPGDDKRETIILLMFYRGVMLENACGDDPQAAAKPHVLILTSWQALKQSQTHSFFVQQISSIFWLLSTKQELI